MAKSGTKNYVKQQVQQQMGVSSGFNKKQQKRINKIVIALGSLLGVSTVVNIVNLILLINIVN